MANEELQELVADAVEAVGCQLWGLEYSAGSHGGLLRVYIDSPEGVGIEDCERASHQIASILNVHDPIQGEYDLEVSSPGLDRPLFTFEQYQHYVGKKAKFVLQHAVQGKRRFRGVINAVDVAKKQMVVVAEDNVELLLTDAEIAKVNLVFEFEGGKKHGK